MQKPTLFDPFEPITIFSKYIRELSTQWIENEIIRSFMAYWVKVQTIV
ncbi:MAG: hypothetical protein RMJ51_02605 [Candidatus Calescibacterium sp.]|nr:hypothetical protein [Candidatus Calescibacterium sp.]MCX7972279.1 hypothetical protein [bacterium]MDW8195118.1 hypothetical protein [Candidatus Calescibacterium sp.]